MIIIVHHNNITNMILYDVIKHDNILFPLRLLRAGLALPALEERRLRLRP